MKLKMIIETSEVEFKRCIAAAWENRYEERMDPEDIKDFAKGDEILSEDIKNMLLGSSLGELVGKSKVSMERIE